MLSVPTTWRRNAVIEIIKSPHPIYCVIGKTAACDIIQTSCTRSTLFTLNFIGLPRTNWHMSWLLCGGLRLHDCCQRALNPKVMNSAHVQVSGCSEITRLAASGSA